MTDTYELPDGSRAPLSSVPYEIRPVNTSNDPNSPKIWRFRQSNTGGRIYYLDDKTKADVTKLKEEIKKANEANQRAAELAQAMSDAQMREDNYNLLHPKAVESALSSQNMTIDMALQQLKKDPADFFRFKVDAIVKAGPAEYTAVPIDAGNLSLDIDDAGGEYKLFDEKLEFTKAADGSVSSVTINVEKGAITITRNGVLRIRAEPVEGIGVTEAADIFNVFKGLGASGIMAIHHWTGVEAGRSSPERADAPEDAKPAG